MRSIREANTHVVIVHAEGQRRHASLRSVGREVRTRPFGRQDVSQQLQPGSRVHQQLAPRGAHAEQICTDREGVRRDRGGCVRELRPLPSEVDDLQAAPLRQQVREVLAEPAGPESEAEFHPEQALGSALGKGPEFDGRELCRQEVPTIVEQVHGEERRRGQAAVGQALRSRGGGLPVEDVSGQGRGAVDDHQLRRLRMEVDPEL
mmetsp:Transcript_62402/g.203665  ORF Transcript_62402/g.203665 Transcript_62402/m.203665 type:complete len:205 (+) Transcript_62402:1963-2577(+)